MAYPLVVGAVADEPSTVTLWQGLRRWLRGRGLPVEFVLHSHFERQVEELVEGRLDAAWNSPLAWVRARRLGDARGLPQRALVMRDTDRDATSVVVVLRSSEVFGVGDLGGRTVATGAVDSAPATLLPSLLLRRRGVEPRAQVTLQCHTVTPGLHGAPGDDEREAIRALLAGLVDAACVSDITYLLLTAEGLLPPGVTRVVGRTDPYDLYNLTVPRDANGPTAELLGLLQSMDYADEEVRFLMDLAGVTRWVPGRITGYDDLEEAVDAADLYDEKGNLTAPGYEP